MADIPPRVPGATGPEPMKKTTGKVAPKKETVRISLPPKPSAAPTIKLPTLPPGGPTGAPSGVPSGAAPRVAAPPPPAPRTAAPAAPRGTTAAPRAGAAPRAAAPPRTTAAPTVSGLDKALAIVAGVAGLVAVGGALWIFLMLKNTVETFSS